MIHPLSRERDRLLLSRERDRLLVHLRRRRRPSDRPPSRQPEAWQAWREQNGRWVPDGWIKPGYFADPPQFEPRPGEKLKTPGFEASCFQQPASPEPIDVVIPLGVGSPFGDAELRYCLRSIQSHLINHGRIWIVGQRPDWLLADGDRLVHLAMPDVYKMADASMLAKIGAACTDSPERPRLSERFLHLCDDVLLLRPVDWAQLGPYHKGALASRTERPTRWRLRMKHTRDWLEARGKPTLNGDGHLPVPMERDKFLRTLRETEWRKPPGLCVGPLYLNWSGAAMQPVGNRQVIIPPDLPVAEIRRRMAGRWFLCHMNRAFTPELRALLEELFPEKCPFEKEEEGNANPHSSALISVDQCSPSLRVKPAGPTLSVIIPTIGRPTLKRTLDSIRAQQLVDGDEVLVVQDGPPDEATRAIVEESRIAHYMATGKRAGDFGATPRNFGMAVAGGEYLASMDDDDTYTEGAFGVIRRAAARHPDRPLMFRIFGPSSEKRLWRFKTIRMGNVGSTMFVAPNVPGKVGRWGNHRAQDFQFIHSTLALWPAGSLVWCPEVIALYLRSSFTAEQIYASPVRRNLLYHIYPVATNREWRLNVESLRSYWNVFTGRKIVGVVQDDGTNPIEEVQAAFGDDSIEWLVSPNDPQRGESVTFSQGIRRLRSLDPDEVTFYAHAKGVSAKKKPRFPNWLANARRWRAFMYGRCLGDAARTDRLLRDFACCGALRTAGECFPARSDHVASHWHFAGTFFWFNHARYFGHPMAGKLGNNRFAVERHLGQVFSLAESYCLAGEEWPGKNISMYRLAESDWDRLERPASA